MKVNWYSIRLHLLKEMCIHFVCKIEEGKGIIEISKMFCQSFNTKIFSPRVWVTSCQDYSGSWNRVKPAYYFWLPNQVIKKKYLYTLKLLSHVWLVTLKKLEYFCPNRLFVSLPSQKCLKDCIWDTRLQFSFLVYKFPQKGKMKIWAFRVFS